MSQVTGEFRIELELLEPGDAAVEVVRYWYSLGGTVIGARDAACSFEVALSGTEALLRWEGARHDVALAGKPLDALYTELYLGLLVDFDAGVETGKHWQRYARFQALPIGTSSFHGWNAFLVENDEHARFIWVPPDRAAKVCEVYLPLGAFEVAQRSFRRELEDHFRGRRSVAPVTGARVKGPIRETG
jgi:hypothetical protein